ncbi:MAG: TonB-dependent receptor plug domain-containing protein [Bacteroidales bacterium]|nr:TonB-dependent receptor plug domain-containing protein [Bacteroidales bacterium]
METKKYILGTIALGLIATTSINHKVLAQDTVHSLDEVFIRDTRVNNKAPLTTTTLNKEALSEQKTETSIPYIIELQPSVVASSENCQAGNTSLRIRGVDASRINVNINGITLNDPESHAVFWVNIPNLGGMAQSLQIQRGIGASTGGAAAFGAAINLQTLNAHNAPYGVADISYGSWNTRQYSIGAGTGITKSGLSFDINYTGLTSDGYIRNGFTDQQSVLLNAGYYGERTIVKALAIIGKQRTGITWNGATAEELDNDPRFNSSGLYWDEQGNEYRHDDETDNYKQQHYQLHISHMLSDAWSLNAAFDYTHGYGYDNYYQYQQPASYFFLNISGVDDSVSDFKSVGDMGNNAYTAVIGAHYEGEKISLSLGESMLFFDGLYTGHVFWAKDTNTMVGGTARNFEEDPFEYYNATSNKRESTTYLKLNYDINADLNLYGDLQYRYIYYRMEGIDEYLSNLDFKENYHFFNPKAGINWRINSLNRTYFVAGISHREPTRADIQNNTAIKPEAMLDLEIGYQHQATRFSFAGNIYAMLYRDQLTPSGEVSIEGYALMENVEKSYRIGIELEGGYKISDWVKIDANLTLSQNKAIDYTYTDFNDGDLTCTTYTKNTDLSMSPDIVGAAMVTFEPVKKLKLQLTGKYVGSMYGDNTQREVYKQDAYFHLNCRAAYTWNLGGTKELEAQFIVRNILNQKNRLIAWTGDGYYDAYYHWASYFQQPGINYTARLIMRF